LAPPLLAVRPPPYSSRRRGDTAAAAAGRLIAREDFMPLRLAPSPAT